MRALAEIEKSSTDFQTFQQQAMVKSGNLPLVGHLLEPLQRLLRYGCKERERYITLNLNLNLT